jgi:N-methylhydantoinase A
LRYRGQSYALNLPWTDLQHIAGEFHQRHKDTYGHELAIDIELVNLRVRVTRERQSFVLPQWQPTQQLKHEHVSLPGVAGTVAVISRAALPAGYRIDGPALITETSATTWLAPGWRAEIDSVGNINCRVR